MVLLLSFARRSHVPLWALDRNFSICGQMVKMSRHLWKYQLHSTLNCWWLGLKRNSIVKLFSLAKSVQYLITVIGVLFPKNFLSMIKTIFKRLFRVYAHIYHSHFQVILALGLEYHLNTCFKHFIFFIDEFELVEEKELAPLSELIQQFKLRK